ncbi:MAG: hypothetical protein PHT75_03640 [Bacilli bacterium]|nr:hypothetical protein [Bacilli bacterium]MDD3305185.1 hypothetical protein [Bacilli bacterium]MDD4053232.1 hypothetical protein [Bacilli bacterium]MDD4411244.1 hypothetical protein [Bacilli bacterium]
MGDIFNEMVIFLEDYYVYVIGVGLIIVLMLIGFLASSKKSRKESGEGETMANINDVNTGSINDVANTLQNDNMQPVDVVTFPETNNLDVNVNPSETEINQLAGNVESSVQQPVEPIAPQPVELTSIFEQKEVEPVAPAIDSVSIISTDTAPLIPTPGVDNVDTKPIVEEITPINENNFDKTEIIDLSTVQPEKSVEVKPTDFTPFVVNNPQNAETDSILNGETSPIDKPENQQ